MRWKRWLISMQLYIVIKHTNSIPSENFCWNGRIHTVEFHDWFFFQWSTIEIISCSQISKSAGQFVRGYNASYFDIILEEVSIKKNGEEFSVEFKNIRTLWGDKIRSLWFVNEVPILSKSFSYTFWWLRTKYNYWFKL